jgi:hypothetical protein
MTAKVDLEKVLASSRATRGGFRILDVPELRYLMIDGHGDPNSSPEFAAAVETRSPVACTLEFASEQELGRDHLVPPLRGSGGPTTRTPSRSCTTSSSPGTDCARSAPTTRST